VGEQDARLLAGLALARTASQAALVADVQAQRGSQGLAAWRAKVRREQG